jgi:magnesium transporter
MLRTNNLSLVLNQLESALEKRAKLKRTERKAAKPPRALRVSAIPKTLPIPETPDESNTSTPTGVATPPGQRTPVTSHAWWLNVSSPSWDDLRTIGKLLHLHPLTLEDILVQDSREKLDVFTKLGYYFVVFQALAGAVSPATRLYEEEKKEKSFRDPENEKQGLDKEKHELVPPDQDEQPPDGFVQAINVYMVVFKEGIVTVSCCIRCKVPFEC